LLIFDAPSMPKELATFLSSGSSIPESSPAALAGRLNVVSLIIFFKFHFLLCFSLTCISTACRGSCTLDESALLPGSFLNEPFRLFKPKKLCHSHFYGSICYGSICYGSICYGSIGLTSANLRSAPIPQKYHT
jgi:hypothetical protein